MRVLRKHNSNRLLGSLYRGLLLGFIAARTHAGFAPAAILWAGLPTRKFILAPGDVLNSASGLQQNLMITDQFHTGSGRDTPRFSVKPDNTIAWDARNLCVEADAREHSTEDTVYLSQCTGGPNQKWDCLHWGSGQAAIRLIKANKCLSVGDRQAGFLQEGWNRAPVVLRECEDNARGMWGILEPPVPTGGSSPLLAPSPLLHHVLISLTLLAILGASSLSAWLWWWQPKAPSQFGIPWKEEQGGISLVTPVAVHQSFVMSGPMIETRMPPAAMVARTIPGVDVDIGNLVGRDRVEDDFTRREMCRLLLATMALTPVTAGATAGSVNSANSDGNAFALRAAWTATDGYSDSSFIQFDEGSYAAMRDDERRTPLFEKAITQRLNAAPPNTLTVLEIGTGPYALFALMAIKAGAKKVYTIEADREAAKRAREVLRKAKIGPDKVQVIDGFSTDMKLPVKVDLLIAEIAGSVTSEEGVYATIRDVQSRFMLRPSDPASYIPCGIQTLAAPVSYALQYALGPPRYDWGKYKEPVRLNCRDESAQLLADPQVIEDISLSDTRLPISGVQKAAAPLKWRVDSARIDRNEKIYYDELTKEGINEEEARDLSRGAARSLSAIGLWPRLVLDPEGTLIVESRGPRGENQKSHWQTVLPLLGPRPVSIEPAQTISATYEVDLGDGKPNTPLKYVIESKVN